MTFYTDYPIEHFGDVPGITAPMREVEILFWDMDKYVRVLVQGPTYKFLTEIKYGYIYHEADFTNYITPEQLNEIQAERFLSLRQAALEMQATVANQFMDGNGTVELIEAQKNLARHSHGSRKDFEEIRGTV